MANLDDLLLGALGGGEPIVVFEPDKLSHELVAYGEPEAAEKLICLGPDELRAIGRRAHHIWTGFSGESGPMLDKAICLAVVEHLEGKPRDLKRRRRQYPKEAGGPPGSTK
jgi:hypothetical protein